METAVIESLEAPPTQVADQAKALLVRQGARIRDYRKAAQLTIDEVSKRTGLHQNTIGRIERGNSEATTVQLLLLASVFQVHPGRLMHFAADERRQGDQAEAVPVGLSLRAVEFGPFLYVPHFAVSASAGDGADLFSDPADVKAMRPFDLAYVRGKLGITHNELVLLDVQGHSMEPFLHSDDTIMVDLRMTDVLTEGVHVIRMDGALLVKKIQRLPGRVLKVSSQNPDYSPFEIQGRDDSDRDFQILGRAMWAGVTIK